MNYLNDHTSPDKDADKSGTDKNSDSTQTQTSKERSGENKYDKPGKEVDPDTTLPEPNQENK